MTNIMVKVKLNNKKVGKKGRFQVDISFLGYQNTIHRTYDNNNNCRDSLVIKNKQNHCDFEETGYLIDDGFNIVPQHSKPKQSKQHIVAHYR